MIKRPAEIALEGILKDLGEPLKPHTQRVDFENTGWLFGALSSLKEVSRQMDPISAIKEWLNLTWHRIIFPTTRIESDREPHWALLISLMLTGWAAISIALFYGGNNSPFYPSKPGGIEIPALGPRDASPPNLRCGGLVVDEKTGMPIENARVEIRSPNAADEFLTDENGMFRCRWPDETTTHPLRVYDLISLRVTADGYEPYHLHVYGDLPRIIRLNPITRPSPKISPEKPRKRHR